MKIPCNKPVKMLLLSVVNEYNHEQKLERSGSMSELR